MKAETLHVWAGIWDGGILGPYFFNGTITRLKYLQMLNDEVWPSLQVFPNLNDKFWMQDGAPPHWLMEVRAWLDEKFPFRWIGRDGPIPWPPRSPDITPMDFSVWGTIKDRVRQTRPENIHQLKATIIQEFQKLDLAYCAKTCGHVIKRMERCKEIGGFQVEKDPKFR